MKRLNEATGVLEPRKKQTVMEMEVQADACRTRVRQAIKKAQEGSK